MGISMDRERYSEESIILMQYGRQDCSDMHSWGPGMRQCYIIHYVVKGAGYIKVNNKCYRAEAGQSFIIYPFTVVHYYPDTEQPWEYVWIDFAGKDVPEYLQYIRFKPTMIICPVIPCDKMLPLFESLSNLDIFYQNKMEANGLLQAILGLYADSFPAAKSSLYAKEDNRLSVALRLVHTNYHKFDFNVENLCTLMNLNRVTLYRLFKNKLDSSPNRYILKYRLEQARTMLELGISVKSTSVSCGFGDQFYFSKVFKKCFGSAPAEYRKQKLT